MGAGEIESAVDALYRGPLEGFTPSRNELAKELKAKGDRAASDRVKALGKPSVTAWAVNQLHFDEPAGMERLLEASRALRTGLERGFGERGVAGLRDAQVAMRLAADALVGRARELLEGAGHAATPAALQRIQRTLEAIAARDPEAAAAAPAPPRLTADLEPPGFEQLAGLSLAALPRTPPSAPEHSRTPPAPPRLVAVPEPRPDKAEAEARRRHEQALVAARVRADEAARKAAAVRDELVRAERGLEEIAEAHRRARERRDDLRSRLEGLDAELAAARSKVEALLRDAP